MKRNILIVEDETIVAIDIQSTLTRLGYEVSGICSSGEDAIKKCGELSPDLVLMDIKLKGSVDGIEAAQKIKDDFFTPVVYLTSYADEATLERAKVTEPFGYILKPFEEVELRVALELALFKKDQSSLDSSAEVSTTTACGNLSLENIQKITTELKKTPLLSSVHVNSINQMLNTCIIKNLKAGDPLAFEGAQRDFGFIILSGRVSLFKTSLSGKELIVELLAPTDLFGLTISIEEQPYSFSARAQIDSEVLFVPRQGIVNLLSKEPKLYREFIALISNRLSRSHDISRSLAHDRVEKRIANALITAIPQEEETINYLLHITRRELAELAGTTVETAIRVTKRMEKDELLDLSKVGCIRIPNASALREFALEA